MLIVVPDFKLLGMLLSFILESGIRNYGPRYPGLQIVKEKYSIINIVLGRRINGL
jgi:hypothetical protein